MTRTIQQIINSPATSAVESAIQAAYWAGQSQMRGQITEQIKSALQNLPTSRYHRIVEATARHVAQVNGVNQNHLYGHGDSGSGEAAEFLSWDFEV